METELRLTKQRWKDNLKGDQLTEDMAHDGKCWKTKIMAGSVRRYGQESTIGRRCRPLTVFHIRLSNTCLPWCNKHTLIRCLVAAYVNVQVETCSFSGISEACHQGGWLVSTSTSSSHYSSVVLGVARKPLTSNKVSLHHRIWTTGSSMVADVHFGHYPRTASWDRKSCTVSCRTLLKPTI